jgi:integrase
MFIIGFHCGLRISDLKVLQLGHFIREDGTYKEIFSVREQKTKNRKPDKETRTVYVTEEMIAAIETYKQYHPNWTREDYLFPNGYDENYLPTNKEMTLQNIDKMIKAMADKLELDRRGMSSHAIRKTFAYHILQQVGNDDKGVRVLQKILGHSSFESTQYYLGISQQDMMDVCTKLHLGV